MNRLTGEKGVSLVELLVVASMLMVVLGAVLAIVDSMLGNYLYQSNRIESQDQARQGMIIVAKTIRQAERPLLIPEPGLYSATNELQFSRGDLDGDEQAEYVRYSLDATNKRVVRQEIETTGEINWTVVPQSVVISNVINDPNNSNQALFVLSGNDPFNQFNVRVVTIHLFIDTNPGRPPSPVELSTDVQLRNFAQYP